MQNLLERLLRTVIATNLSLNLSRYVPPIVIEKFVPVLIYLCVPFSGEIVTIAQNTPISNFEGMGAKPLLAFILHTTFS